MSTLWICLCIEFTLCVLLQMYWGITWTWQQVWSANIQFLWTKPIKYQVSSVQVSQIGTEITICYSTPSTAFGSIKILQHLLTPKVQPLFQPRYPEDLAKCEADRGRAPIPLLAPPAHSWVTSRGCLYKFVASCHLPFNQGNTPWHKHKYNGIPSIDVGMLDVSC